MAGAPLLLVHPRHIESIQGLLAPVCGSHEDVTYRISANPGVRHVDTHGASIATCEMGMPVCHFTTTEIVMLLSRSKEDGSLTKLLRQLTRTDMLILDELGFLPLDADGARLLFQVVSDGYERQSVVVTTNLEFSRWGQTFGDEQMAATVIDRVVHHGRLLQFSGKSYRVRHALMRGEGVAQKAWRRGSRIRDGAGSKST